MQIELVSVNDYFKKCNPEINDFLMDIFYAMLSEKTFEETFEKYKDSKENFIQYFIVVCRLFRVKWIRAIPGKVFIATTENNQYTSGVYVILTPTSVAELNMTNHYFRLMNNEDGDSEECQTNIKLLNDILTGLEDISIHDILNDPKKILIEEGGKLICSGKGCAGRQLRSLYFDVVLEPMSEKDRETVVETLQNGVINPNEPTFSIRALSSNDFDGEVADYTPTKKELKQLQRDPNVHSKRYKRQRKYF